MAMFFLILALVVIASIVINRKVIFDAWKTPKRIPKFRYLTDIEPSVSPTNPNNYRCFKRVGTTATPHSFIRVYLHIEYDLVNNALADFTEKKAFPSGVIHALCEEIEDDERSFYIDASVDMKDILECQRHAPSWLNSVEPRHSRIMF